MGSAVPHEGERDGSGAEGDSGDGGASARRPRPGAWRRGVQGAGGEARCGAAESRCELGRDRGGHRDPEVVACSLVGVEQGSQAPFAGAGQCRGRSAWRAALCGARAGWPADRRPFRRRAGRAVGEAFVIGASRALVAWAFTEPCDMRKSFNTLGAVRRRPDSAAARACCKSLSGAAPTPPRERPRSPSRRCSARIYDFLNANSLHDLVRARSSRTGARSGSRPEVLGPRGAHHGSGGSACERALRSELLVDAHVAAHHRLHREALLRAAGAGGAHLGRQRLVAQQGHDRRR